MYLLFLYVFCVLASLALLAVILPVRLSFRVSGGTEDRLEFSGRIMLFAGAVGGGLLYRKDRYRVDVYLSRWMVLSMNVRPLVTFFQAKFGRTEGAKLSRKAGKKRVKKPAKPLLQRIRELYRQAIPYGKYFTTARRELRGVLRIEQVSSQVTLGLGNPALTGSIVGYLYALNGLLPSQYIITPKWEFSRCAFQGELSLTVMVNNHIFWYRLVKNVPLIIAILRERRRQKKSRIDSIIIQEV